MKALTIGQLVAFKSEGVRGIIGTVMYMDPERIWVKWNQYMDPIPYLTDRIELIPIPLGVTESQLKAIKDLLEIQ